MTKRFTLVPRNIQLCIVKLILKQDPF